MTQDTYSSSTPSIPLSHAAIEAAFPPLPGRTIPKGREWPCAFANYTDEELLAAADKEREPYDSKYYIGSVPGAFEVEISTGPRQPGEPPQDTVQKSLEQHGGVDFTTKYQDLLKLGKIVAKHGYGLDVAHVMRHAQGAANHAWDLAEDAGETLNEEERMGILKKHDMHMIMTEPDAPLSTPGSFWARHTIDGITQCTKLNEYLQSLVDTEGFIPPSIAFSTVLTRGLHTIRLALKGFIKNGTIALEEWRSLLHTYLCDMRRDLTTLKEEFPEVIFDPSIPEHDPCFRTVKHQNRLALAEKARSGSTARFQVPEEHMGIIKSLLNQLGNTALDEIEQLADHVDLLEGREGIDSPLAQRVKRGLDKTLDTKQTLSRLASKLSTVTTKKSSPDGFWLVSHGTPIETFLEQVTESNIPEDDLKAFKSEFESSGDTYLGNLIDHQENTTRPKLARPGTTKISIVPFIYKLKDGEEISSTIGDHVYKIQTQAAAHSNDSTSVQ